MQLLSFLKEIIADLLHRRKLAKRPTVKPYKVDRSWVDVEREKVNDEIKDRWN